MTQPHHKELYNQIQAILQTTVFLKLGSLILDTMASEDFFKKIILLQKQYSLHNSTCYMKMSDQKLLKQNLLA